MDTDVLPNLLPCAICARTFMPESLEKHKKICEKAALKKRKPFDSAKQRIQGTDLADFLPKQEKKRQEDSKSNRSAWKQTHNEFLRTIRAARVESVDGPPQRAASSQITASAPTRGNDKGACPTCNRHFGIKAYDRHVAWCKERSTRLPTNPATNLAKERFEARMKYRAPGLKTRRPTNREKYFPGSAVTLSVNNINNNNNGTSIVNKSPPQQVKAKGSVSLPNCNKTNDSVVTQKPITTRRSAQRGVLDFSDPIKSRVADRTNSGSTDYDPFVLAEQQMSELLSDTSDQSDLTTSTHTNKNNLFPLTHSSAFVKYPFEFTNNKRSSLIAPPTEFNDLTSDFSSDSTETNSLSREIFLGDLYNSTESSFSELTGKTNEKVLPVKKLGRRAKIDKSKALGNNIIESTVTHGNKSFVGNGDRARKILDRVTPKASPKVVRLVSNRSHSFRASSAPKSTPERKSNTYSSTVPCSRRSTNSQLNQCNQPDEKFFNKPDDERSYVPLSGSNLSLNSIISSSEIDVKRSNSAFDELLTSFEDDRTTLFPSLKSFLKDGSLTVPSHPPTIDSQHHNGNNSDEELSSPDSFKRQEHGKLSADSAYSSLNRKYSHHGRSTNDVGRFEEDCLRKNNRTAIDTEAKYKMSKFCHECGMKFPETAKFCCECGVKRLAL